MPLPGEIRIVNGKRQIWIPDPAPVIVEPVKQKRTITSNKNNFEITQSGRYQVIDENGAGHVREIVIVADKPIHILPLIDGVDVLGGRNRFEELAVASIHSKMIEARRDDPDYIVSLTGLHYSESANIQIWVDSPAIISNLLCVYDILWQN